MSKLLGAAILFFGCLLLNGAGQAQGKHDPCSTAKVITDEFRKVSDGSTFSETLASAVDTAKDWFSKPFVAAVSKDEAGVYFTRRSGFKFVVDCSNLKGRKRITRVGRYGVGYIVKPIGKSHFSPKIGAPKEPYLFVQTEGGLNVFVRRKDLMRMVPNEEYIFNTGSSPVEVCTNLGKNRKRICNKDGRVLESNFHFAMLRGDETKDGKKETALGLDDNECRDVKVSVYNGSRKNPLSKPDWKYAAVSICGRSKSNGLKSFSVETAEKTWFAPAYPTGSYTHLAALQLQKTLPYFVARKKCRGTIRTKNVISLSGALHGDLNILSFAKVAGKGELIVQSEATTELKDKNFYFYPTFHLVYDKIGENLIGGMRIEAKCQDGSAFDPEVIMFNFSLAGKEYAIGLKTQQLEETAKKRADEEQAGAWLATATGRQNGRLYQIADFKQLAVWTEVIQGQVDRDLRAIKVDIAMSDFEYRKLLTFFTDLVLATVFEHVDTQRNKMENKHPVTVGMN
jgi:hypothetical protein